jgi:hypothetical protein
VCPFKTGLSPQAARKNNKRIISQERWPQGRWQISRRGKLQLAHWKKNLRHRTGGKQLRACVYKRDGEDHERP